MTRFDISLFKNIRLAEQVRLQVRAEAFNAFNHTNYNTIGTAFGTPADFRPRHGRSRSSQHSAWS